MIVSPHITTGQVLGRCSVVGDSEEEPGNVGLLLKERELSQGECMQGIVNLSQRAQRIELKNIEKEKS